MVAVHLAFRAWASLTSWFYLDDYLILREARSMRLDADYLLLPYNGNLMIGGRLVAEAVDRAGDLHWTAAAASLLIMQAIAAVGALWACLTVFGRQWGALVPLALYLTSAMTLPVMMWWIAGLNQTPLQGAFFWAVGAWVQYLRSRAWPWLLATEVALLYGLLFYVKAILIVPVLAFLAVAYFARGSLLRRLGTVVTRYWPGILVGAVTGVAYGLYYVTHVPAPFTETSWRTTARIADTMIVRAFGSGVVGGPWRWDSQPAPNSFADPPTWAVVLAWAVILAIVAIAHLGRRRTLRVWLLLVGYLGACLALLVNSRGPSFGPIIGLEYRYLTDAAIVAALCVGLLFLEIPGAEESSQRRTRPRWRLPRAGLVAVVVVVVVTAGGIVSSVRYLAPWHHDNASDAFMHQLQSDLSRLGTVDLLDAPVPDDVYAQIFAPDNMASKLVPLVSDDVQYPESSSMLTILGDDGRVRHVEIQGGTRSLRGPAADCGWRVRGGRTIPMNGRLFDYAWIMRIGYLASQSTPVTVKAGETTVETSLRQGLNELYVRVDGAVEDVVISGLDLQVTVCVDPVRVGNAVPGYPL